MYAIRSYYDNDCDGVPDSGYVSQPTTCGMGACFSLGSTSCVEGIVWDNCTPGQASAEACGDEIDNGSGNVPALVLYTTLLPAGAGAIQFLRGWRLLLLVLRNNFV